MTSILFLIETILRHPIQMQLCEKQKAFFKFVEAFSKARLNFEHFQKKMTVIPYVF